MTKKKKRPKRSKGQRQLEKVFRKMGYDFLREYVINKLPYDLYIPEYDLIIEYQGSRWHYDKRLYSADYFDKVKNRFAYEKWEKDEKKKKIAVNRGHNFLSVWEYDWKQMTNKRRFIEKILRKLDESKEQKVLSSM